MEMRMVLKMVMMMVLMIAMMVLTSTLHISHKGSKPIDHVVGIKDNDVDDDVNNSKDDSVVDGVDDGDDGAYKHLTHLSQWVDCHLTWRSKQNKHVVGNKDYDVDDDVNNSKDDSVVDGVEDGDDGADKHLIHLSQG
eukprot:2283735-Ditylum_brightwellii.AAC.1